MLYVEDALPSLQAIHDKVIMLELDEAVPEAQTVDCQLSASDGVIVQVTGNLQCKVRAPVLGMMQASLCKCCSATAFLQPLQRRENKETAY